MFCRQRWKDKAIPLLGDCPRLIKCVLTQVNFIFRQLGLPFRYQIALSMDMLISGKMQWAIFHEI